MPLRFGVVECLWRRQCKEVMGYVGECLLVKVPSKQVVSSKEVVLFLDVGWRLYDRESKFLSYFGKSTCFY